MIWVIAFFALVLLCGSITGAMYYLLVIKGLYGRYEIRRVM